MITYAGGIDTSRYQHYLGRPIDWLKVASQGYYFAAIRLTCGDYYIDPMAMIDWTEAGKAGFLRTIYHVVAPNRPAEAQIEYLFKYLDVLNIEPELPIVLDCELHRGQTPYTITSITLKHFWAIKERTGVMPLMYTNANHANNWLLPSMLWKDVQLWVANYTLAGEPYLPKHWKEWLFWQYSDKGKVNGIPSKSVDLDYFNGSVLELYEYADKPLIQPAPVEPEPGLEPVYAYEEIGKARVIPKRLNVRMGPGRLQTDIGDMSKGMILPVIGKEIDSYGNEWLSTPVWVAERYQGVQLLDYQEIEEET